MSFTEKVLKKQLRENRVQYGCLSREFPMFETIIKLDPQICDLEVRQKIDQSLNGNRAQALDERTMTRLLITIAQAIRKPHLPHPNAITAPFILYDALMEL